MNYSSLKVQNVTDAFQESTHFEAPIETQIKGANTERLWVYF
jgi:hypothetical protein